MNISQIISSLYDMPLATEQEVRTKVAVPILECLGYTPNLRAEEFSVFMMQGRESVRKTADILLFSSSEYEQYKDNTPENRKWVYNHSLIIVELKKPKENIEDSLGQALK